MLPHPEMAPHRPESSSLGRRLTLPFLEGWNPNPTPPLQRPNPGPTPAAEGNRQLAIPGITFNSRIHLHYVQPPMMAPVNGLILLGDSEKKVLLDSGRQERETARRLPLSPLSSVLIPSGWSPRRCGLLTLVF